jgi:type VI secretion system secreted protein VgrG
MASLGSVSVTPLHANEFFFRSLSGDESMSGLYEFTVQLLSTNPAIKLAEALGENMTVTINLSSGKVRYFNGFITRFTRIGISGGYYLYRAVLHPWLWFLGRTADCRIFQNHNIPDIVKKVFKKHPVHLFDEAIATDDYKIQDYLVQYRETDLNFVSRLLERVGIAYHFTHALGQHTLVLTDSIRKREAAPDYAVIPLRAATDAGQDECLTSWHVSQEVDPAAYVLKDFDYLKPNAPLVSALAPGPKPDMHVQGEIYDYPGQYLVTTDVGDKYAAIRLQQVQTYYETIDTDGSVRGIGVGNIFGLSGHLSTEGTRQFLVVKAHYEIHGHSPEAKGDSGKEETFHCSLTVLDAQHPFRPARNTPTPIVQGPQTATVVGLKKEETNKDDDICTDKYGRILVTFHWERLGELKPHDPERANDDDDNTKAPCWLRVAQLWAGPGWGTVFIPRIGQEVMVEFLEGDPDRPIVTGRVYNQDNKPAYLDESKKTQSGIRSHSTPGGGPKNFNELRFDDKKGSEEVYLQAEKDQLNLVKHNRTASVGANDAISVGGDRSVTISGNLSVTVKGGGKSPINSSQEVTGKYKLHATDCIDIEAPNYIKLTVGKTYIEIKPDTIKLHADGGGEIIINANVDVHSNAQSKLYLDGNANLSTSGDAFVTGGKTLALHGTDSARIEGKVMTAHADTAATLEGDTVTITGTTKTVVSGGGSSVTEDSGGVDVAGTAIKLNA